jgi:Ran GTPase-activating protein (RanGAP) involved in mRNA processing and transport
LTGIYNGGAPFSGAALSKMLASKSISDLYLSRLSLGGQHFRAIADALGRNTTLRVLDLFGNNLSNKHIVRIVQGLQRNQSLETFVLPCPSTDLTVESSSAISKALQVNKTLLTLNLPRSSLSDEGLFHLAQGLTVNTTLKKIEVGVSKNLGDKGSHALTEMLEKNY